MDVYMNAKVADHERYCILQILTPSLKALEDLKIELIWRSGVVVEIIHLKKLTVSNVYISC